MTLPEPQNRAEAPPAGPAARPLSALEQLRATGRAAFEEGNWALLNALQPLIDAEQKRASAASPVSLEVMRSKREGGK